MPLRGKTGIGKSGTMVKTNPPRKTTKQRKSNTLVISSQKDDSQTSNEGDRTMRNAAATVEVPNKSVNANDPATVVPENVHELSAIESELEVGAVSEIRETMGEDMTSSMSSNDITGNSSISMTAEDLYKAQYDGTDGDQEMLDEQLIDMSLNANQGETPTSHRQDPKLIRFNMMGARPKHSSPNTGHQTPPPKEEKSEMNEKINEMMKIMEDVRDIKSDMKRIDNHIRKMEERESDSSSKLREGVQKTVEISIAKLGTSLRQNLVGDVEEIVNEKVRADVQEAMENVQERLLKNIEDEIDSKTDQRVQISVNEAAAAIEHDNQDYTDREVGKLEKAIDRKIKDKVEQLVDDQIKVVEKRMELKMKSVQSEVEKKMQKTVDEKISNNLDQNIADKVESVTNVKLKLAFEEYDEKLWRRHNILVCNLEESTKKQ